MTSVPFVRPYRSSDRPAVGRICVLTAHNGGDATPHYADPTILPTIFAYPYVDREPELSFVIDDGDGEAVGYIVGTADTPGFVGWFRDHWLPAVVDAYPPPTPDGGEPTPDRSMAALLHNPERMVLPQLRVYPAHLHIDILPPWQGKGLGRALMDTYLAALHEAGVDAVHLCMAQANTPARAFYDRVGFQDLEIPDDGPVWYLGRPTAHV
ncbi:GNAT family N-acetyltransferase [Streptomyces abyssomicinicus]|uniref:GNAT family N-acetyltransferase n=1 Tax=Streptomyces abyssomicinicus TaxID=574929 RepID=UPI00124FF328|nr:GNAT family N-acetyltransferase [Streptomyces abyssomicinicus]